MKIKSISISALIFLLSLSSFVFVSYTQNRDFQLSKNLEIYYSLFEELNTYYVDETDPSKLIKTSIDEMLKSLDPYTVYIPESQMEDFRFMTTGQYGGIGALIRKSGDYIVITDPYENFPAHKAKLKAGDVIIEIDGKSIKGKNSSDVSSLLKGQPNTELELTIKRPGVDKEFTRKLTREEIKLESVPYYGMINDKTGYINLSSFTMNCGNDVKKALVELKEKHGMKNLILDLRGNPGGLLIEAVNISGLFVKKGELIVSTKGKVSEWDKSYYNMLNPVDEEIPLVVLVNSGSASASEIVSGAIQDLDRGVIVGQRTFGKGLVQTTRSLAYNSKLKVTTAKYYIPSGRCIQALDYTHRNDDGSVGKIPDSLISEFKTKAGRLVYDGGGVTPDVTIPQTTLSSIAASLYFKNHIFDFATQYAISKDSIDSPEKFTVSDEDYKTFIDFLQGKDFDYQTKSESDLDKLIETAKKEKYYNLSESEFGALKEKLAHDPQKDLNTFKNEITELLNEEIISRYYYQKGRLKMQLRNDPEVVEAVKIIEDKEKYKKILEVQ
ncbi:MAG: S41 family peptidase [Bacteroidales bacterium]|nr:S41 family peptidase [Bacteroidales bacterium]